MTRELTGKERDLWSRITKDVIPLGSAPVNPIEGLPIVRVSLPRTEDFRPVLDLHGLTVHEAFKQATAHINDAFAQGRHRYVIIITGLSGQIHDEFPKWVETHRHVRSVTSLRGGGAWEVWLKKVVT